MKKVFVYLFFGFIAFSWLNTSALTFTGGKSYFDYREPSDSPWTRHSFNAVACSSSYCQFISNGTGYNFTTKYYAFDAHVLNEFVKTETSKFSFEYKIDVNFSSPNDAQDYINNTNKSRVRIVPSGILNSTSCTTTYSNFTGTSVLITGRCVTTLEEPYRSFDRFLINWASEDSSNVPIDFPLLTYNPNKALYISFTSATNLSNFTLLSAESNQDIIDSQNKNTEDIINNQNKNKQDIVDNQNKNTQDVINNQNKNKQDIVDNQNKNTQDVIDNQNKNTQDTIDNQNKNTDKINENLQNCRDSLNLLNPYGLQNRSAYGITVKYNSDGSLTFNGTSTTGFNIYYNINFTLEAGTYTFSSFENHPSGFYVSLDNLDSTMIKPGNRSKIFTLNNSRLFKQFVIWIDSGKTFNDFTIYPQIQKGNVATKFEPYGSEVCSSKLDDTNDKLNETNQQLGDLNNFLSDDSQPESDISSLGNVTGLLPPGPLDSVLNIPFKFLSIIVSSLSDLCVPLSFKFVFNEQFTLPCFGDSFYSEVPSDLMTFINLIPSGFILIGYFKHLYKKFERAMSLETTGDDEWGVL